MPTPIPTTAGARVARAALVPLLLFLGACAGPLSTRDADPQLTPAQAVADGERLRDTVVVWGGVIVAASNLETATRIELLAYPLDRGQRPDTSAPALGRVMVFAKGYLETLDYAPGRRLTVRGWLDGVSAGQVDQHPYRFPVVQASQLHLWPEAGRSSGPDVHFGIGVTFGL